METMQYTSFPSKGVKKILKQGGRKVLTETFTSIDFATKKPTTYAVIQPPYTAHPAIRISVRKISENA